MDEISQQVYSKILPYYKNLPEDRIKSLMYLYGYNVDHNMFRLDSILSETFDNHKLDQFPMEWFAQWLPYASQDTQEWYTGWVDYNKRKAAGEQDLDAFMFENAEYPIKRNLLMACKPIRDKITEMCQNETLYDPNVY